jgi:uracil-DNA glycosylase
MSAPQLDQPIDALVDALVGDWRGCVETWRSSAAGRSLIDVIDQRVAAGATVYPRHVFNALERTPLARTRVVIVGQDPYHGEGQAEGLAFSVPRGVRVPPSLRNLFKELGRDLHLPPPANGHLGAWAARGVLLLNASLTVEAGAAASHAKVGWHHLTDAVIAAAASDPEPRVFMLWGAHAQAKAGLIAAAAQPHLVLCSNHPSPLSALRPPLPFIGCGHFGVALRFLNQRRHRSDAFDWSLEPAPTG